MASHISGRVDARLEPIVPIRLRDCFGLDFATDAIVDTGFTGELTLPPNFVAFLGLKLLKKQNTKLVDGTIQSLELYHVEIEWEGVWKQVVAISIGDSPLIGMKLLEGNNLAIDAVSGGTVDVTSIP